MNIRIFLLILAVATLLAACGSGGNLIEPAPAAPVIYNGRPLEPGTYKLTFSAISTARLVAPITGIDVAVKLPVGLSVSTVSGGSGQITSTSVAPAIQSSALILGNYSSSTRTAYFYIASTQDTYRSGQFMTLLFTVSPGSSVSPDDIFTQNATYPKYKVVGLDKDTQSSVNMTATVKTTLGVER